MKFNQKSQQLSRGTQVFAYYMILAKHCQAIMEREREHGAIPYSCIEGAKTHVNPFHVALIDLLLPTDHRNESVVDQLVGLCRLHSSTLDQAGL